MIKVPSEGNDNPIDKVIFYKKPKGKNLLPAVLQDKEVQEMVSYITLLRLCCYQHRYE